jgi:predicted CXXCH cytochrome family protein
MSKIKMSFSLILAIFLVGILSTAAFAKDAYGLKPVQNGLALDVPFTGNSADAADIAGRSFDLVLLDGSTVVSTTPAILDATKKGKVTYAAGILTPGKAYTVKLYHTDDAAHSTVLSTSSALVQDAKNTGMYQTPDSHVDLVGSGQKNANSTGYNNTRKQKTGQKVHGFYQNNTNSCASCHQTHTGADDNLLFKDGVYSTCSACHDGTTGAYNNWAPISEENVNSLSGTFNVDKTAAHNGSLHTADGSLKISAAPGGNTTAADTNKQWGQEFDCASCHAAHGSGTASENNLNLDPMGFGAVEYVKGSTDKDVLNGKLFKLTKIYTPTEVTAANTAKTMDTPYILVKLNLADQAAVDANFFYKRANVPVGNVIQLYRWNGSKGYAPDYSLFLREKGYPYKADTKFMDTTGTEVTNLTVVWRDGFAYGTGLTNVTKANVSIGVDVETTDEVASLFDSANPKYIKDSGLQMSKYCTSCHTDYLSATRTDETGNYTLAHRHQTASDSLTCVRCHYGHGSEAQIMLDANDNNYYELTDAAGEFKMTSTNALDYLKDINPSSALKRYTGMSVCYACHGGGEQFLGNQNNGTGTQALTGHLKAGQPGTTRSSYSPSN